MEVTKQKNAPDQLTNMSVEQLIVLRDQIEAIVGERIEHEKRVLLSKLEAIRRFEAKRNPKGRKELAATNGNRAKAVPKYRNPVTGETWAGRGLQPKWMRKAIECGHSVEEFRIRQVEAA